MDRIKTKIWWFGPASCSTIRFGINIWSRNIWRREYFCQLPVGIYNLRICQANIPLSLFSEQIGCPVNTLFKEEQRMSQEQWEYMTEFIWASHESQDVKEFMKARWPNFKPDKYSPETMIRALNIRGEAGWELVSMQPVFVGSNGDVVLPSAGGSTNYYTHIYFCAFKRRINL